MLLIHFLDCEVKHPAGADCAAQVRQHHRIVLWRHVLERVDRHGGVELAIAGEVLQPAMLQRDGQIPRPGLRQHARGLVDACDPHASSGDQREVPTRPAWRIQHRPASRDHLEHPADPLVLHLGGIVDGRRSLPHRRRSRPRRPPAARLARSGGPCSCPSFAVSARCRGRRELCRRPTAVSLYACLMGAGIGLSAVDRSVVWALAAPPSTSFVGK